MAQPKVWSAALIGDMIGSRRAPDRNEFHPRISGELEAVDIMEFVAFPLRVGLAEVDPLQHPQHVPGGEHGADRSQDHPRSEHPEREPF